MRILPVNKNYKNPDFRGLWGDTYHKSVKRENYSMDNIVFNYYPFQDESKDAIEKIVKENSFEYTSPWFETGGKAVDYSKSVKLHEKLPFTKGQYQEYCRRALLPNLKTNLQEFISNALEERNLHKFILPEKTPKELPIKTSIFKKFFAKLK